MKKDKLITYCAVMLVLAELVLVLVSWILSATMTGDVRSLLSSEGIRWFFGHFIDMLLSPVLAWLLLLSMTGGCLWHSRILRQLSPWQPRRSQSPAPRRDYRQRLALRVAVLLFVIYVSILVALTLIPHALLLSSTGHLFPSAFSRALVPIITFGVVLVSASYAFVSGSFRSLTDVVGALSDGIAWAAHLFLLYVLCIQFFESLRFVFL